MIVEAAVRMAIAIIWFARCIAVHPFWPPLSSMHHTDRSRMQALLNEEGSLERLCQVLFTSHVEACKLVLDMLLHILIFSEKGYFVVIKVLTLYLVQRTLP